MPIPTLTLVVIILTSIFRLIFATVDATINEVELSEPVAMHISHLLVIIYSLGAVSLYKLLVHIYWSL